MMHPFRYLLSVAAVVGMAAIPTGAMAQSTKSDTAASKSDSKAGAAKSQSKVDEFEENRRAHMNKSKENNTKKGAE